MNVLCLGSEIIGASVARELVEVFLAAQFDGGERYVARLRKSSDGKGDESMAMHGCSSSQRAGSRSGSTSSRASSSTPASCGSMIDEVAVTGLTSNPSIFQKAIAGGGDYDDQIRELARRDRRPARDLLRARDRGRPRRVRRAAPGVGGDERPRRLRLARGRPDLAHDTRRDARAGDRPPRPRRPAEPLHQDPGDARRACRRSRSASRAASRSTSR